MACEAESVPRNCGDPNTDQAVKSNNVINTPRQLTDQWSLRILYEMVYEQKQAASFSQSEIPPFTYDRGMAPSILARAAGAEGVPKVGRAANSHNCNSNLCRPSAILHACDLYATGAIVAR